MVVIDGVIANVAGFDKAEETRRDEAEETWQDEAEETRRDVAEETRQDEAEETRRDEAEETRQDMASGVASCTSMGCRQNCEVTYLVNLPLLGPPCGFFEPSASSTTCKGQPTSLNEGRGRMTWPFCSYFVRPKNS